MADSTRWIPEVRIKREKIVSISGTWRTQLRTRLEKPPPNHAVPNVTHLTEILAIDFEDFTTMPADRFDPAVIPSVTEGGWTSFRSGDNRP